MRSNKGLAVVSAVILAMLSAANYAGNEDIFPPHRQVERQTLPEATPLRIVRGLQEPLVATGIARDGDAEALDAAVSAYLSVASSGDLSPLQQYVDEHPESVWRIGVLVNLGLAYYHEGYFTRAMDAWHGAWVEGREYKDPLVKALVDRAVGELARMHARVGRSAELTDLFDDIGDRHISGPATEMITGANEALWLFDNEPGIAFLCGPMALKNLLINLEAGRDAIALMDEQRSGPNGFNLEELAQLAETIELDYRLVFRKPGEPIPVPSIVNWKLNHYAAIVGENDGRYHIQDPTFGSGDAWYTEEAIDEEASGYYLVPVQDREQYSWRSVSSAEASLVYGMGVTSENQPGATTAEDTNINDDDGCGMCVVDAKTMVVSLSLKDTPVGYSPPLGPSPRVQLTYNQREANQPAVFSFFNVGPKWNLNVLSWIEDNPTIAGSQVVRHAAGGGSINYSSPYTFDPITGEFSPERQSQAVLVRIPAAGPVTSYELRMPDGSKQVFAEADGANIYPRRLFLTELVDAASNSLALNYDDQLRLTSLTDATGRDTTFSYGLLNLPLLVTRITDPFGRYADLNYDEQGRLSSITDVIGLTSMFDYDDAGLVNAMTTPYGSHSFVYGDEQGNARYLEMTDPLNFTERLEFRHQAAGIPYSEFNVPQEVPIGNQFLEYRNTFYWDKRTYPVADNDYTQARITHWLHNPYRQTSPIIESTKEPLESRVWRTYPGQSGGFIGLFEGTAGKPSTISRVLDDEGTTQATRFTYNAIGNPLTITDPIGRESRLTYADNNIDVIQVEQRVGDDYVTLAETTYNASHQPLTHTDTSGQTTAFTYNDNGQLTSQVNPLGQRTAFEYDALGYLIRIIDANGETSETLTYDTFGRMNSRTDSESYMIAYEYDAMDRTVSISFPDGTAQSYEWDRLDLVATTDRLERTTRYAYDANRRLVSMTDPLDQTTRFAYDPNGDLIGLTDPNGNTTNWERDLQGRIMAKVYADGTSNQMSYESVTSRLQSITDALGQIKSFTYSIDDRISEITYDNARNQTPNVDFTWDDSYPRLLSMTDGIGTTMHEYGDIGNLGANQLVSVMSPVAGNSELTDMVTYQYDALGREIGLDVEGFEQTMTFDAIGRPAMVGNSLGQFTYNYTGATSRVASIDASRGPQVALNYYGPDRDYLLKDITYTALDGTELSAFGYQYNANNNVTEFTQRYVNQQLDVVGVVDMEPWDTSLNSAFNRDNIMAASFGPKNVTSPWLYIVALLASGVSVILMSRSTPISAMGPWRQPCIVVFVATFTALLVAACDDDSSGRSAISSVPSLLEDGVEYSRAATEPFASYEYDDLDRLTSVSLDNDGANTGMPSYAYVYDPASNITRIETPRGDRDLAYTIINTIAGGVYDENGSPTLLNGATYEWDPENRLVKWTGNDKESRFTYDGQSRLVRIVDLENNTVVRDHSYTWCGLRRCLERDNLQTGSPISKAYFHQGTIIDSVPTYNTYDHLGSVRQVVESDGAVVARYDYDAYGDEMQVSGISGDGLGYAGLFRHEASGLNFAIYRTYDPSVGRWLNRDPIQEIGGVNLYTYVENNPVNHSDMKGLFPIPRTPIGNGKYLSGKVEINSWTITGSSESRDGYSLGTEYAHIDLSVMVDISIVDSTLCDSRYGVRVNNLLIRNVKVPIFSQKKLLIPFVYRLILAAYGGLENVAEVRQEVLDNAIGFGSYVADGGLGELSPDAEGTVTIDQFGR